MSFSEASPLLGGSARTWTPLPKLQLAIVFLIKLVVPVASTQMLPYVNDLVLSFGFATDPAKVGMYSGLLESASPFAQLLSTYPWGHISDRWGRKPVILAGTVGLGAAALIFGLSRTLVTLLAARTLSGLFSGTVSSIHSVVGELTDATNQSLAFPVYDLVSALGFVLGPLIGGNLYRPATIWPWFSSPFWRKYPYALPCIATCALALVAFLAGLVFLVETLPAKAAGGAAWVRRRGRARRSGAHARGNGGTGGGWYGGLPGQEESPREELPREEPLREELPREELPREELPRDEWPRGLNGPSYEDERIAFTPPTTRELFAHAPLRAVLLSGTMMALFASAYNAVFVLFCFTPVDAGGVGLSPSGISYALAFGGLTSAMLKLLVLPPLLARFDTLSLYRLTMAIWPVTFALFPALNYLARAGVADEYLGAGVALVAFMSRIGTLAFSISMILVRTTAPGPASLGAANGLAEVTQSLAIAASPILVSSLFSFSINRQLLGGYGWAAAMVIVSLSGTWFVRQIRLAMNSRISDSS